MEKRVIELLILSPEKTLYNGTTERLLLPGEKAPFVVLYNHAPIISSLGAGTVVWQTSQGEQSIAVSGGFAEVKENCVTVCVELI